ncbi:MAG TPA: shikimate dehydrogenase [Gammaproteobacteria bacterium]|nr:shikimate dehydrogenase [Gammaproteobacteria bacterium]
MADRYALFGHPVAHSVSPALHAAFARQTGQEFTYDKHTVAPDDFSARVKEFFAIGGKGLNITLPFKGAAFAGADRLTPRARQAQAVNTLWRDNSGALVGDNTDGAGFIRDLTVNHSIPVGGKNILLIGAGGAARGIIGPLLEQAPARLHIANRTASRATELAALFGSPVTGGGFDVWPDARFDLIINATAAGHEGVAAAPPDKLLAPRFSGYDLSYGDVAAPFLQWAQSHRAASACDGWGMLVEQAAESFYLWRGLRPDTAPVIADREAYFGSGGGIM